MCAKTINAVKVDDIVYKDTNSVTKVPQNITECKLFLSPTHIKGDIDIKKLNENDIKAAYESSWLNYKNTSISGNIVSIPNEKSVCLCIYFL